MFIDIHSYYIKYIACLKAKEDESGNEKVVNGKLYDTEKAELLHRDSYSNPRDFDYWQETLYVTPNSAYFIYGEGGARSKYRWQVEQNCWTGGADITPVSSEQAIKWLEEHDGVDVIMGRFAGDVEDA